MRNSDRLKRSVLHSPSFFRLFQQGRFLPECETYCGYFGKYFGGHQKIREMEGLEHTDDRMVSKNQLEDGVGVRTGFGFDVVPDGRKVMIVHFM